MLASHEDRGGSGGERARLAFWGQRRPAWGREVPTPHAPHRPCSTLRGWVAERGSPLHSPRVGCAWTAGFPFGTSPGRHRRGKRWRVRGGGTHEKKGPHGLAFDAGSWVGDAGWDRLPGEDTTIKLCACIASCLFWCEGKVGAGRVCDRDDYAGKRLVHGEPEREVVVVEHTDSGT